MKMSPCHSRRPHPNPACLHFSIFNFPFLTLLAFALSGVGGPLLAALVSLCPAGSAHAASPIPLGKARPCQPPDSNPPRDTPTTQSATPKSATPSPQKSPTPLTAVTTSWEGIPNDFMYEPPDTHGSAGPQGIIATVNLRIAYFDKTGRYTWGPVQLSTFFSSVGNVPGNLNSDPRSTFDRGSGRFYVIMQEADFNAKKSYVNLAVSKTSNPATSTTTDWFFFRFENTEISGSDVLWTDYPGLGSDSQAVYVTWNMFSFTTAAINAEILVLDKNAFNNGNTNYGFAFTPFGIDQGFTLQPCSTMGSNSPANVAYFAETATYFGNLPTPTTVRIWALSDPLGARTLTSTLVTIPDNGGPPPFSGAPQPGTGIPIDTLDGRAQGNAFWFNGAPNGTPTLAEEGFFDGGPGEGTYQPSIGGNALGDVGFVYSQSSGTTYPSIFASTRKAAALAFDTPVLVKASPSYYFGGRWGDYASVTADPNDESFWVAHEWSKSTRVIDWSTWWANIVARIGPNLTIATNYLTSGNFNGLIDPNECNDVIIVLTNTGSLGATNIQATLSTTTPGVILAQRTSTYRDLPVGSGGTNVNLFKISTTPEFLCGTPVKLSMVVKSDQDTQTNLLTLISGSIGREIRFDSTNVPVPIPDDDLAGVDSSVLVSNITSVVGKVTVSLHIPHQFVSDLALSLIGPDGTINVLSANHGGFFSHDYGVDCVPDGARTTFDDASTNPISAGFAPFVGTYAPDQRLAVFSGKSGTNINGLWRLHAVDSLFFFTGTIECWSLSIFPAQCTDGGGECPGVDLAVGMIAAPEPVFIGSNLVYSITVTNFGPGSSKNTVLSEVLDSSLVFVSATVSQGNVSYSGGVVTATLGKLNVGATATATVVVTPTIAKLVSSTASV